MKAIAILPGRPGSVHLAQMPPPRLEDIGQGRGALVKVLQVGLCGTDREISEAEYGIAPPGSDFLVLGHENFGVVEQVGPQVTELAPGDYVVTRVRRPGASLYDAIGLPDMTTDDAYYEHGISRLHGFLTERYVDSPDQMVRVPAGLRHVGVLVEPLSIVEKGIAQAYEIQRRLRVWRPRAAAVLGAGTIGVLATLALRLRGVAVAALGLREAPYRNSDLVEALGGRYFSTRSMSLPEVAARHGPFDLIFEATGYSPLVFDAMAVLGKNGVLVLSSITGGDRRAEVPTDALNLGFVLGNKVMVGTVNSSRRDYEAAVRDLALAEAQYPGWLSQMLTHRVQGLDSYLEAFGYLTGEERPIKVVVEVALG